MTEALTPLAVGWHGKLPCRGDFVGRGLPPDWLRSWDDALRHNLAKMEQRGDPAWRQRLAAMPPWQALVLPPQEGPPAWLCLLLPSTDAVGRTYPLLLAEAHASARLGALGTARLRSRGHQWAGMAQQAAVSVSPQEFDRAAVALGAHPWPALPAADTAGPLATLAQWRQHWPQSRSFWWSLLPTDANPPRAEAWPPGDTWLPALLGC